MQASNKIKAFIAHEEALVLKYMDDFGTPAGGFSHHDKTKPIGTPVTVEEAIALMDADCHVNDVVLSRALTVVLTQPQFDALSSLAYNIGCNAVAKSDLVAHLNSGDTDAALVLWQAYEHRPRREREIAIFQSGDYGTLAGSIIPVYRLDTYDNPHGRIPDEWIPWPGATIGD